MESHNRNKSCPLRGAVLCAALAVAAGGGASAAPTETLLHSFAGGASDGSAPVAGLLADKSGNLYGTTEFGGGEGCGGEGCGTVFKLSASGTFSLLHSFAGGAADGAFPAAGLIADTSGNLYATTVEGGASDLGVVFKL